jgi:hypothetical protein
MKKLKAVLLVALIALGLAGTARATVGCCPSDDCCAACSGCKK